MSSLLENRRTEHTQPTGTRARMPRFVGCTVDATSTLESLRVLVAGAGSVGRTLAEHMARLHVGALLVCDPGRHKAESLLTHPIPSDEIGQGKAICTARACQDVAPTTRVRFFDGPLQDLDLGRMADYDVLLLASDNLLAEQEAGWRCSALGMPLVQASVHGDTLTAQVRFLANGSAEDPCPLCAFGPEEWRHLDERTRFRCDGTDDLGRARRHDTPTVSVSFLCSLAADLAATQVTRHVLGLGRPVANTLVEANGYTHRTRVSELRRNPECRAAHESWRREVAPRPLAACSLREIALSASADAENASFLVGGLLYCERSVCGCGRRRAHRRFVRERTGVATCSGCGGPADAAPFDTYRRVPAAALRRDLDRPLAELSDADVRWVVVSGPERPTLVRSPAATGGRSDR